MTPSGIEPATFRFVAQHLNYCATAVPVFMYFGVFIKHDKSVRMGDSYVTQLCLLFHCKAASRHTITATRPIHPQEIHNHYNHLFFPTPLLDIYGFSLP